MALSIGGSKFSSDAILIIDPSNNKSWLLSEVEVLVVAGGGGGGRYGAGGGGGGVVYRSKYPVTPGVSISVTIGTGGAGHPGDAQAGGRAGDGGNSIFGDLIAQGGGGGGNYNQSGPAGNNYGSPGGSGGGAGSNGNGAGTQPINGQSPGGAGVEGQGFPGGSQSTGYATGAGGGGGAGAPGETGKPGGISGNGGIGKPYTIAGTLQYYGGGGGGGAMNGFTGVGIATQPSELSTNGGLGGGGQGISQTYSNTWVADGQDGLGGGGGGGADNTIKGVARAGNGGKGTVIVRYPGQRKANGGHHYMINGYSVHIFDGGGDFTPNSTIPANTAQVSGLTDLSGNGNSLFPRTFRSNNYNQPGTTSAGGAAGDNAVTFTVQGTGTFVRLGHGQVIGGYKVRPSDCIYRYELGVGGCHYHGNSASLPSGWYGRWFFDYYISQDAQYYPWVGFLSNVENYGNGAASAGVGVPNSLKGIWQSIEYEFGPSAAPAGQNSTQAMFLYPGGCGNLALAARGYILMRNPTVQFYPSYIIPTFNSTTKSLVFDGDYGYFCRGDFPFPEEDFTISMWVKTSSDSEGFLSYAATDFGGTDNEVLLYASNPMLVFIRGNPVSSGITLNNNTWKYITVTRSISGEVLTYSNGVYVTTITTLPGGKIRSGGSLVIGGEQDSTGQGNFGGSLDINQMLTGEIGGIEIYERILHADEILINYNNQKSRFGL